MTLVEMAMHPANLVCDRLKIVDENERVIFRVFVNTLVGITVGATGFFVAWMVIVA